MSIILASYLWLYFRQRVLGRERMARKATKVHERNARRLYRACIKLRGVYIKMGQVLSIMGTFLPGPYMRELEKLQDAVPPQPYRKIRKAIKRRTGHYPEQLFARFSKTPVAAASLGQVHEAWTHDDQDGRGAATGPAQKVAVKVLYPKVETLIRVDLRVIGWAMSVYKWFVPMGQMDRFLEQLRDMLMRETNLEHEATCIAQMSADFADDPDVSVPEVIGALSGRRILTMTFMDGVKVSDKAALAELGLEPEDVAKKLIEVFYKQMFNHRFFQADPHPGNFFAQRGAQGQVRLVLLDLGAATRIRDNLVEGMLSLLSGFMSRNDAQVFQGIETLGFVAAGGDRELLRRTVKEYFQKLLSLNIKDLSLIDSAEIAAEFGGSGAKRRQLRQLMKSVEYPLGWFYVERAGMIMFALCAYLAPRMSTMQVGMPYVMRFIADNPMPVAATATATNEPNAAHVLAPADG